MLRYLYTDIVFQEVPDEVSLAVAISGCQIRCKGCHSRDLWEDKGTPLTPQCLGLLLKSHQGVTCLCLFGGEHDMDTLTELFMYAHKKVKTAWYAGLDILPKKHLGILGYLDYLKLGHYDDSLGGLDSPTTNQHLYRVNGGNLEDITYQLQNNAGKT